MPCTLSRTALVTALASLASFAMHAQDSQQQETYNPVTYEEIENPDPTEWSALCPFTLLLRSP